MARSLRGVEALPDERAQALLPSAARDLLEDSESV
jgi:hypothetical protein